MSIFGPREHGGGVARFMAYSAHGNRSIAELPATNNSVLEGRTIFRKSVEASADVPRILVSGLSNSKVGGKVRKGPWRNAELYTLTLEERATCPSACGLWRACYGNSMPFARRVVHDDLMIERLAAELRVLTARRRIVVRLHVLGDFYSEDYARQWVRWLVEFPRLHVFGYTAHPVSSPVGRVLMAANEWIPGRCRIRFTVAADAEPAPLQVTTIWRKAAGRVPEGIVCPAQTDGTQACSTCGLCWAPAAADQRIVFVGHGRQYNGGRRAK